MGEVELQGTVFGGDFEVIEPLGSGGMGEVYIAKQLSTGKRRALKVMHARLSIDTKQRERFTQEARVAAAVDSDHVVEIIAAGVNDDNTPWIAMELLDGQDLSAYLKRVGPLTLGGAGPVLEQLCHALGAAHDAGIVHRDLKPHNVFMSQSRSADERRVVKVLDFGIAKLIAESTMSTTAALGSPAWMSPEQTEASPNISPRADVWPIGLLTFWMLTGRSFWRSANSKDGSVQGVLREMVIEDIPSGSARAKKLGCAALWPAVLDPWLARCLEREPKRRFVNASEAYEGFVAVLDGEELPPPESVSPATAATVRTPAVADDAPEEPSPASLPTRVTTPSEAVDDTKVSSTPEIDRTAEPITKREREASTGTSTRALAVAAIAAAGVALFTFTRQDDVAQRASVSAAIPAAPSTQLTAVAPEPAPSVIPTSSATVAPSASSTSAPSPPSAPAKVAPRPRGRGEKEELPPFNAGAARRKIAAGQRHAEAACSRLEGPRVFNATMRYHPDGRLEISGAFARGSGSCVRSALSIARVGPFGPRNASAQTLTAGVTLKPRE